MPTNGRILNGQAKETQPVIRQLFIVSPFEEPGDIKFERKLYEVRRKIEKAIKSVTFENNESYYVVSFSARTIVYKGLLLPEQLGDYYLDLTMNYTSQRWRWCTIVLVRIPFQVGKELSQIVISFIMAK